MTEIVRDQAFYESAGHGAYRMGLSSFDAPYKPGDKRLKWWITGWGQAKQERAKPIEVGEKNRAQSSLKPDTRPRAWTRDDLRRVLVKARTGR